jgi:hypothetical protein
VVEEAVLTQHQVLEQVDLVVVELVVRVLVVQQVHLIQEEVEEVREEHLVSLTIVEEQVVKES